MPSLLNTVTCPSRYPMTCLILTSRLSDLKRTHYWVRDDEKSRLFGLKNLFRLRRAPSSGISLSGGQVSDGRLRRGLIAAVEHPHDMLYNHSFHNSFGATSVKRKDIKSLVSASIFRTFLANSKKRNSINEKSTLHSRS